jgi:DNA-binding MarR family transcriptional regulator
MPDASAHPKPSEIGYANRDLVEAAAAFSETFQRWLKSVASYGRTYPELRLIEELHCHGPAKMRALADSLGFSARNMTALADALAADGLLRRAAHPTDRRVTLLELTPAGAVVAEKSLAPRLERIGQLFNCLLLTEQRLLCESLRSLAKVMTTPDAQAVQGGSEPTNSAGERVEPDFATSAS